MGPGRTQSEPAALKKPEAKAPPAGSPCSEAPTIDELAPGLRLETLRPRTRPAKAIKDPCLRVLRADPAYWRVELGADKRGMGADAWAKKTAAAAVINASMYHDDGRSTGLLIDGERTITGSVNKQFGAFFAAQPRAAGHPEFGMWGQGCPGAGLQELRVNYALVAQNYRLLDCTGQPIAWKDPKVYSAAAVGIDENGHILFIHSRAPYLMASFTQALVEPELGLKLRAAMYVEGGPEATLFVDTKRHREAYVGSYETGFFENDGNKQMWRLPNVLLLTAR